MQIDIRKLLLALPLLAAACGDAADPEPAPAERTIRVTVGSDARSGAPQRSTRTEIGDDGQTIRWSTDDEIALWASAAVGGAAFEALPFAMYHYNALYGEARFTGDIPEMTPGTYTYYAVAPCPERFEGTKASYTIPAEQLFEAERLSDDYVHLPYDILVADPVQSGALTEGDNSDRVNLSFRHKTHLLKIRIGENNLGKPLTHITLTFPRPVTGTLTLDAAAPDAAVQLTEGSRTLTLRVDRPFDQGTTLHAAIAPEDFTGEPITIRAYAVGRESQERTITPQRPFAAGHTTPIRYNVPIPDRIATTLRLRLAGDGRETLGEPIRSFTLTAPEGCAFDNGERIRTFEYTGEEYEMYLTESPEALSGQTIDVAYESEHAIVRNSFRMPAIVPEQENDLPLLTVPWLLFEDFSSLTQTSDSPDGNPGVGDTTTTGGDREIIDLSDRGLATQGWTATRVSTAAGQAVRLCARVENQSIAQNTYPARLDSAPFRGLKEGAKVNVQVTYNYKGGRWSMKMKLKWFQLVDDGPGNGQAVYSYGATTEQGGQAGGTAIPMPAATDVAIPRTEGGDRSQTQTFDDISLENSFVITDASNAHRASWQVSSTMDDAPVSGANGNFWLYIDNVRVKIVP